MKCKVCGAQSVIRLRAHNMSLCAHDFDAFVLNRVRKAIKKYGMFTPDDRILVAVSGGKDSMALFEILQRLGYAVEGLHIDMGIAEFSGRAVDIVEGFFSRRHAILHRHSLSEVWGQSVDRMARRLRRPTCSLCGTLRRHLLNRLARNNGFSVIATGHNLDDEGAALLGNVINWRRRYLARQSPMLPASHPSFAGRAKPLVLLSEREILAYSILREISYHDERCPHSKGATSSISKVALNLIEYHSPGTKIRFYQEYVKNQHLFADQDDADLSLSTCSVCGMPTTRDVCQFCTVLQRVKGTGGTA